MLWNSRPKAWCLDEMAKALYVGSEAAKEILDDLCRRQLIVRASNPHETYRYESGPSKDELIAAVDNAYRRELIRITRLIHSKPSAAIRAFARAFRFKKDPE